MSNEPTLPIVPEADEALRARYAVALQRTFEPCPSPRPAELREHVFDFNDGIRFVVSRDLVSDPKFTGVYLHVSASLVPKSEVYNHLLKQKHGTPGAAVDAFRRMAEARFRLLSDREMPAMFGGVTEGGVLHWLEAEEPPRTDRHGNGGH